MTKQIGKEVNLFTPAKCEALLGSEIKKNLKNTTHFENRSFRHFSK